jgi:hypothetical protein
MEAAWSADGQSDRPSGSLGGVGDGCGAEEEAAGNVNVSATPEAEQDVMKGRREMSTPRVMWCRRACGVDGVARERRGREERAGGRDGMRVGS